MSSNQVFFGIGLIVFLAVGSQVLARQLRIPALIVLLPVGFIAGALTDVVHPDRLFGGAFSPLVSLAVAIILYDAGLGLDLRHLIGHPRRVVVRLIAIGVPVTAALAAWAGALLLDMSRGAAVMLGTIVVVSGPTVVGPLLDFIRPIERTQRILAWEGSIVDPVGGILGAIVFTAVSNGARIGTGQQVGGFILSLAVGLLGAVVGIALLWLLLRRLALGDVLGTSAQLATVVAVAAVCDALREDTGLIAAIAMGLCVSNLRGFDISARRPFFEVLVQLSLGLLFVSISATVTPDSLRHLVLPTLAVVTILVLIVRPLVAFLSTVGTDLSTGERGLIGWMAPRGIVAAATAATFGASLAGKGIQGAERILPVTFLIIVATVTLYGLTAGPVARRLGVVRSARTRPLLIGGEPWVIELAGALRKAGLNVLLWTGVPDERERVRAAGFELAPPDVVAAATGRGVKLEGVTDVYLLTDEDDFNAVAATLLADTVDSGVFRVAAPTVEHGVIAPYVDSGLLFGPGLSGAEIRSRYAAGARIVARRAVHGLPPGPVLLFVIDAEGRLLPALGGTPSPGPADTVVLLTSGA